MSLAVSFEQSELSVDPGGFVRAEVRIANPGSTADRARLVVTGPAAAWAWVIPPELEVAAGGEAAASVGFRVPRAADAGAGRHPFDLVVSSTGEPGAAVTIPGALTIASFREVSLHLEGVDGSAARRVVVANRGNVAARATLAASPSASAPGASGGGAGLDLDVDPAVLTAAPGESERATLRVGAGGRPLLRRRSRSFAVTAVVDGAEADDQPATVTGTVDQAPVLPARTVGFAAVAVAVALVVGVLVAAPGDDPPSTVAASGTSGTPSSARPDGAATTAVPGSGCIVDGHIDPRVTGLEREDIPTLPADFSFFEVASDGCTPVRWNPCEPVHYVINPANAPPTGVEDVREAFRRLAEVTGMEYVEDGMTDETGASSGRGGRAAYQPERYGERWAPILVHWQNSSRASGSIQVVGGGFPTLAGDVYVTGNLFLNPSVVTNAETRTPVAGGFGAEGGAGPIGPQGVTWGRIILHELAHITGLGHVRDPRQLMYPETSEHTTRPARFDAGDLAGLRHLSKEAGCLATPPLDTPTRGISRGGSQSQPGQGPSAPGLSTPAAVSPAGGPPVSGSPG